MPAESILNRKALRDFHILDRYEAGIELKGSEVKSIRAGKANISDAFARIEKGEAFLYNADIQPYEQVESRNRWQQNAFASFCSIDRRSTNFTAETQVAGRALVVLKLYWKNGRLKAEIGVAPGQSRARQARRFEKARNRSRDRARSRPLQSQTRLKIDIVDQPHSALDVPR